MIVVDNVEPCKIIINKLENNKKEMISDGRIDNKEKELFYEKYIDVYRKYTNYKCINYLYKNTSFKEFIQLDFDQKKDYTE